MILSNKHSVQVCDNSGWIPLHEATNNYYCVIVKVLLESGALINYQDGPESQGITPLNEVCDIGHVNIALLLLEKGADARLENHNKDNVLDKLKF